MASCEPPVLEQFLLCLHHHTSSYISYTYIVTSTYIHHTSYTIMHHIHHHHHHHTSYMFISSYSIIHTSYIHIHHTSSYIIHQHASHVSSYIIIVHITSYAKRQMVTNEKRQHMFTFIFYDSPRESRCNRYPYIPQLAPNCVPIVRRGRVDCITSSRGILAHSAYANGAIVGDRQSHWRLSETPFGIFSLRL